MLRAAVAFVVNAKNQSLEYSCLRRTGRARTALY